MPATTVKPPTGPLNFGHPLANGLLSAWLLNEDTDEGIPIVADFQDSVGNTPLNIADGVPTTNNPAQISGYHGKARQFPGGGGDAAENVLAVFNDGDLNIGTGDLTLGVVFDTTFAQPSTTGVLIGKGGLSAASGYQVNAGSGGGVGCQARSGATIVFISSTGVVDDGLPHTAMMSLRRGSATGMKLYLDGRLVGQTDSTPLDGLDLSVDGNRFAMGGRDSGGFGFIYKGNISGGFFWNIAVSETDAANWSPSNPFQMFQRDRIQLLISALAAAGADGQGRRRVRKRLRSRRYNTHHQQPA